MKNTFTLRRYIYTFPQEIDFNAMLDHLGIKQRRIHRNILRGYGPEVVSVDSCSTKHFTAKELNTIISAKDVVEVFPAFPKEELIKDFCTGHTKLLTKKALEEAIKEK